MRHTLAGIPALLISGSVLAEPAVFTNGEMTIPEGVVISGDNTTYYIDIRLTYNGEGALLVAAADKMPKVLIENIEIMITKSFPLQVSVAVEGIKSVPCTELLNPAVSYADNTFTVVLAETKLGPAESCIAVTDPFETSVTLDVLDLPAGTYTVNVNEVTAEFTFDIDNSSLN